MTAFQEPLERGWLRTVLNDVRAEVDGWSDERISLRQRANEFVPEPKVTEPPASR